MTIKLVDDIPRIMLRDMSDLDEICPSYMTEEMSMAQYWTGQGWHAIPCVQYRHEGKRVILHKIVSSKKFCHITWYSCDFGSSDVLPDTTHCL